MKSGKPNTFICQLVQIRGLDDRIAESSDGVVLLVVGKEEENVRFFAGIGIPNLLFRDGRLANEKKAEKRNDPQHGIRPLNHQLLDRSGLVAFEGGIEITEVVDLIAEVVEQGGVEVAQRFVALRIPIR